MKITEVGRQKKNSKRFNIFLDGKFGFGADEDTVVNFRLLQGKEISDEDLEKILFETEVGKLMERMYGLFGRRDRSEKEIRDYISRKNLESRVKGKEEISEFVKEALIKKLKGKDLLDDRRFAKAWVESRGKKRGNQVLKMELYQKGIEKEIIDQVISYQSSVVREDEIAEQALERKLKSFANLSDLEFKKKATDFLLRRGFGYDIVKVVVEKNIKKR